MVGQLKTSNIVLWLQTFLKVGEHFVHGVTLKCVVYVVWMDRFLDEAMEMRKRSSPLVISVELNLIQAAFLR